MPSSRDFTGGGGGGMLAGESDTLITATFALQMCISPIRYTT